jgi:hypothetical protein
VSRKQHARYAPSNEFRHRRIRLQQEFSIHTYCGVADHEGTIRAYLQAVQQFAVQFGILPVKLNDGYKVQLT